jgi:histidinol phosphatase-like PHP family hydrolase
MANSMRSMLDRREVLILGGFGAMLSSAAGPEIPIRRGVPSVDYHAHIGEGITVDRAIELAKRRGVKFGLLQHAGAKGHGYAVSDDDQLNAWVKLLEGKPVFKGIEAEGTDWAPAFSVEALSRLDYIQSDPLGMPDPSGQALRLWAPEFRCDHPQEFMDRYTDFHVQLIATQPIHILAVPTFLPAVLQPDYERLWTPNRMRRVVEAAVKYHVALEIDCRFRVPRLGFLEMARDAGARFSFGSNFQTAEGIGDISYCVEMYKRLGLTMDQFFRPALRSTHHGR